MAKPLATVRYCRSSGATVSQQIPPVNLRADNQLMAWTSP